ncbi:MAG: YceD family protein [Nocardioidaceae bacterium]
MRLDARSPLVINTHEVGRRPGSMRTSELEVPAPAQLGSELLGVPQGSPVDVRLRLEAVMEGVLATGTAHALLVGQCARCLDSLEDELEVTLQELYVYPESDAEENEASRLEGEFLDLEPVLRDSIVLGLPWQPLCQPECFGLCLDCGARLADDPDHAHEEGVDPRWAPLSALTSNHPGDDAGEDEE